MWSWFTYIGMSSWFTYIDIWSSLLRVKCINQQLTQTLKVNMKTYVNLQESYWRTGKQRRNKVWKRSARNTMLTFPFCQQFSQSVDTLEMIKFLVFEHAENFLLTKSTLQFISLFLVTLRSKVDILHHQKSLSRYVTAASLNLTCYHIRC